MFKLLQSYSFKQSLSLSLASNYESLWHKYPPHAEHKISSISVQVLTSAEQTLLIISSPELIGNMLDVLEAQMVKFSEGNNNKDEELYVNILTIVHDFKYMLSNTASPETI